MRGLNQQGEDIFRWSVECLRKSPHAMEENHQRILAMCLTAQGQCKLELSQESTRALADESISILRRLPAGKETILSLKLLEALAGDETERKRLADEALAIARAGDVGWWLPKSMMDLGYFAIKRGDYAEAKALIQEARSVYRGTSNPAMDVQALLMLHQIATLQDDPAATRRLAQECLAVAQDTGYSAALWWLHSSIADNALLQGDYGTAQTHYQAGLALCQQMNEQRGSVFELSGLGSAASGLGNYTEACLYFHDALQLARVVASIAATLDVIGGIAWLLASIGQKERALQLAACVLNQPAIEAVAKARMTQLLHKLESVLSLETFMAVIEDGKRLDVDDTLSNLFADMNQRLQETPATPIAPSLPDPLTERELEVLGLIADGLSNYDIAVQLFVGMSTVKTHVNRILSKLCVKNRTQAVARARELHLL